MKKQTKTIYITDDGKEFTAKAKASKHEKEINARSDRVKEILEIIDVEEITSRKWYSDYYDGYHTILEEINIELLGAKIRIQVVLVLDVTYSIDVINYSDVSYINETRLRSGAHSKYCELEVVEIVQQFAIKSSDLSDKEAETLFDSACDLLKVQNYEEPQDEDND